MLCCVPKRLADGGLFYNDEAPFYNGVLFRENDNNRLSSIREIQIELFPKEDAPLPILLPCAICARTFTPQSLEKHARICERAAAKKRKPFDSAKQRIQGTELAEFLPKQETRRHHQDERTTRSSWKKTHDDFLRTIREARGEIMDSRKHCNSLISSGAPTRANEKGTCLTCNRQFGIKAYDRHVAWCKDRVTRVPVSPATNLAKERLQARIRYRAPALKNRRAINRKKYSPGSAANQAAKISVSSPALVKLKESISSISISSNRESPIKQKPAVVRRPGQLKDSPTSSGPVKSRLADRMHRPEEDHDSLLTSTPCRFFNHAISSRRSLHFPVPPARPKINNSISFNEIREITSPVASSRKQFNRNETISHRIQNDDAMKNREASSARMQKNIVSARSQGHPRVNDIAVNDKILGMTVQPYRIQTDMQKDDRLVTWKQISHKKDNLQVDNFVVDHNFLRESLDRLCEEENRNKMEADSLITENNLIDDKLTDSEIDKMNSNTWLDNVKILNQTYLIRDAEDIEPSEIFHSKWKPIKHSPRIEFYLKDKEDEICEFEQKILRRETVANDEETTIEQIKELKMYIKDKNDDEMMVGCKVDKLKTNDENMENNRKINSEEIDVIVYKTEKFMISNRDEENKRGVSYDKIKAIECNIEKIETNTENTKETDKINGADVVKLHKLSVHRENEKNRQIVMDKRIIDNMKYTDKTEQNLSEPGQMTKSFSFDAMHSVALNVSKKKNFTDQNQDYLNFKNKMPQCESSICCNNSHELKESIVTSICNQPNINKIISLNYNNNQANYNSNPKEEMLICQSNSCRNSLDLTKNINEISSPASCRSISLERNCERSAEEIVIHEESYKNLTNLCNRKPRRNLKRLNCEVYSLPRNLKISNYLNAPINNIPVHIKGNRQYQKDFSFDNIEKDRKTDFNTDSDNSYSNIKSRLLRCSNVVKTEVTTGEEQRKNSKFDYSSDNAHVRECDARGANDLGSSVTLTDYAEEESCCGNEIFLNARVNFPRRASGAEKVAREPSINSIEMQHRIRENMNLLRGSTDSLISSVEFVELASIRRPEADCTYERETIEIIRPSRWSKMEPKDLPDIKGDTAETRKNSERSYWERISKISRSRLTSLYPAEHKFAKKNPRIRILPPVLNPPLVNRSGKDYDPFLLAEQQMNDLLSDTSDQSMTGSPKLQEIHDTLYPLSHSSAFVKYPPSDRRSSLIAPPTEFDDLMSNFSSDSTETNSISREVFLKPDLPGKDAIDSISPKPVRELGRRLIIDKSKALGVDEHRGVVISADRPRKIFNKDTQKSTRSLINRSGSIRASSAPRINSGPDRKTLGDMRGKVQSIRMGIANGQRSSDQNLNQKNNNCSSLSGSNLSLSSIVSSSELDVKRSNSMFDELMTSFEEDAFPRLRSLLNNESFDLSSPGGDRQRNGSLISDEELSSPDSYKPQDHSKLSNDSAYSSLNRKYSHHGRSANDTTVDRLDEDARNGTSLATQTATKCKMSKFCHECGQRFPETAKFCCECGVRRLAL